MGVILAAALFLVAIGLFLQYRRKNLKSERETKHKASPNPPELDNESRIPGAELLSSEIYQLPTPQPELHGAEIHELPAFARVGK